MNIDNRKILGVLPNFLYDYDPTKVYNLLQQVTYLGSTFQSKCDNNNNIPCVIIDGVMQVHESWTVIARGSDVGISHERLDNVEKLTSDLNVEVNNLDSDVKSIGADVTNVTEVVLDKTYDPVNYSGLGRVVLKKKKAVNGKNILTQDMINQPNTIYIIQYDFDLNNNIINIPIGCVLKFEGGSLIDGTLVGNNTNIDASAVTIFNENVNISGLWNVNESYSEWFGAKGNGINDDSNYFQKSISSFNNITLLSKRYLLKSNIIINKAITIKGHGYQNTIIKLCKGIDITSNNNCNISGITFESEDNSTMEYLIYVYGAYHVHINNCCFYGKGKKAKIGIKYYGEKNTYYNVLNKNRFVELEQGIIFSYNVNGSTIIDNEFYQCDTCIIIDSCNGDRIINNIFQNYIYKAIELKYSNVGSYTWGNLILSNYFEGTFETAICDIDFSSNNNCRNNYIMCNKTTHIPSSINPVYKHISNCITSNIILESTGSTYKFPNKLNGFIVNEIFPEDYFTAFATNEFDGCIAPRRRSDGSTDFRAYVKDSTGNYNWRNIVLTNKYGNQIDIESISAPNILQFYGGYIQLGLEAEIGANRLTYNRAYGLIKHSSDGLNWKFLQDVDSRTSLPNYMPCEGYMIFNKTSGIPVWWTGSKWVTSTGVSSDIPIKGATNQRPVLTLNEDGFEYYDSTLKKKILWNGTSWVNVDGTALV